MSRINIFIILTSLVSVLVVSCNKTDSITKRETPNIEAKSIRKFRLPDQGVGRRERDSVVITMSYQDSENGLGERIPIDSARYKALFSNQTWGNFKITPLVLLNGQYVELQDPFPPILAYPYGSILFFSPDRNKYLSISPFEFDSVAHTLVYKMNYQVPSRNFAVRPTKYLIKIRDRKLNESNAIETDTLHLFYPVK